MIPPGKVDTLTGKNLPIAIPDLGSATHLASLREADASSRPLTLFWPCGGMVQVVGALVDRAENKA
jgi:hypothetical protein